MKEKIERVRAAGTPDSTPVSAPDDAALECLSRILNENRAELTSTERLVITQRLLNGEGDRPPTLGTVGKMVNLSKERVRQIQNAALAKLREVLERELRAPCPATAGVACTANALDKDGRTLVPAVISCLCMNGRAA